MMGTGGSNVYNSHRFRVGERVRLTRFRADGPVHRIANIRWDGLISFEGVPHVWLNPDLFTSEEV